MARLDDAARRLRAALDTDAPPIDAVTTRARVIKRRRVAAMTAIPVLIVTALAATAALTREGGIVVDTTPAAPTPDVVEDALTTTSTMIPPALPVVTTTTVPPPVHVAPTVTTTTTVRPPSVAPRQGPAKPTIQVSEYRNPSENRPADTVQVHAMGHDEDGFLRRFVIDYGDGATETVPDPDKMSCRPGPNGYTAASRAWLPTNPPPTHRYSAPGTYTVTVTVFSTGCDGLDQQSASGSFTWVVPE